MSLGSGIFLSALFLGLIALFIFTKDRWRWKRIVLKSVVAVVGLFGVAAGGTYGYYAYQDRSRPHTELWDLKIGMSRADVLFAKGEPTDRGDEKMWQYDLSPPRGGEAVDSYAVQFKNDRVRYVLFSGQPIYSPKISGINGYSTIKDIEEKFGKPSSMYESKDKLDRIYNFKDHNLAFLMSKGKVSAFGIADLTTDDLKFKDR